MIKTILILFLSLIPLLSFSQDSKLSDIIISIAEDLAADDSDPEAVTIFIERLNELAENPVSINSSGESEISRLFFLSDFQVKALVDYAHASGRIVSVYELANIPGFDRETVDIMTPFITLDYKVKINSDSVRFRNTSITNFSVKTGLKDTSTRAFPWKILTKYRFTSSGFSGGFTAEKDPGEKFLADNSSLPDFLSAYLAFTGNGSIRKVVIGDYSLRFGLGSNMNSGIRTGLSLSSPGYMSARDELKPYTSTDENKFFRGIATELSYKNAGLILFFSKNNLDATLGSSSGDSKDNIENLYLTGVHNTPSLLSKKDAVSDLVYGINLSYNFNKIRLGFNWSADRFSLPFKQDASDPSTVFNFEGKINNLYSVTCNALIKRILIYSEFSINAQNKHAFINGITFRPSDRLTISLFNRNYNTGYVSLHGNRSGNSTTGSGESNITGSFNFEAARHLFISGGCEMKEFKWLKYRCSAPTWGIRQELRAKYLPAEKLTLEASWNYRYSMIDNIEQTGIPEQESIVTEYLKTSVRYSVFDYLTFGTRIDYKRVKSSGSKGMLLAQDINYRFRKIPVTIWARYCLFNTDDWDSRLYLYENDLLNSFSIPSLSGEGSRSYIMVKWEINDSAEIRLKYAITSVSTGSTDYENRNELKFQFKIFF